MNQKLLASAQRQLDESIDHTEKMHQKQLTPAAKIMLNAILLESLTSREGEWALRASVMLESYGAETRASAVIKESFSAVLSQAYIDQTGDFITTRDLLSAIQKKWCGIFPIC